MKLKPATPKAWDLLAKLERLAAQGINGEADVAKLKLERLKSKLDFSGPKLMTADLFAGVFRPALVAAPILTVTPDDWDVGNGVKWAVEKATGIRCLYRGDALLAEADRRSARKLESIAKTVSGSFLALWRQFRGAPGVHPGDRGNFIAGLSDGMMDEARTDQALPARVAGAKPRKAKKLAMNHAPGIQLHPYSIAVGLGRQVRFCVELDTLSGELDRAIRGEIAEAKP